MARRPRMTDVAKLAGVSPMTVSRVLNDNLNVSEDTRTRVMQAVEQLAYQRNEIARSLREQSSRQIGILVPNLYDPFYATCSHAIGLVAKEHRYSVVVATSDDDPRTEYDEASRMLRRNVDGLVVVPAIPMKGIPSLKDPDFEQIPIVSVDRPLEGSRFDRLLVQNKHGAATGTQHLIDLGHKRIAFYGPTQQPYTMRMRQQGYEAAMADSRLPAEVIRVGHSMEDTLTAVQSGLASKSPPTAIFCANNLLTRLMLRSLHALKLVPPEPLALVGFDDFETADLIRPGITVVRQPVESLGRLAGEMLFSRLAKGGEEVTTKRIMLPVELVIRGSCGANVASV